MKSFKHVSVVKVQAMQKGHFTYGLMKNMSDEGLCLESVDTIEPETKIDIAIDKVADRHIKNNHRALVRWCGVIAGSDSIFSYELGIKFL